MNNIFNNLFWHKAVFLGKKHEKDNVYTFIFKPEKPLEWLPGQYIDYKLNGGQIKHFTIASAPYEGNIHLTTRIFEKRSDFKSTLIKLKANDGVNISKPQGSLTANDPKLDYVFIAGGIGITPFRAIIWDNIHKKTRNKMTLLYAYSTEEPPFQKELDKLASSHPLLTIKYYLDGSLIEEKDIKPLISEKTQFLIAGPPKMVDAYQKMLINLNIPKANIKIDSFTGY